MNIFSYITQLCWERIAQTHFFNMADHNECCFYSVDDLFSMLWNCTYKITVISACLLMHSCAVCVHACTCTCGGVYVSMHSIIQLSCLMWRNGLSRTCFHLLIFLGHATCRAPFHTTDTVLLDLRQGVNCIDLYTHCHTNQSIVGNHSVLLCRMKLLLKTKFVMRLSVFAGLSILWGPNEYLYSMRALRWS